MFLFYAPTALLLTFQSVGYGQHGDYLFGWKGDALQKAMDHTGLINDAALKTQSVANANKCTVKSTVNENIDGCKYSNAYP